MADNEQEKKDRHAQPAGEPMPTFANLWRLRHYVHSLGNLKLWREVTIVQFIGAVIGGVAVWFFAQLFIDGTYAIALGAAALVLVPRGISIVEDAGRPPMVEAWACISYLFSAKLYIGAGAVQGANERRVLSQMLDEEDALAGGSRRGAYATVTGPASRSARLIVGRAADAFRPGSSSPRRGAVGGSGEGSASGARGPLAALRSISTIGSATHRRSPAASAPAVEYDEQGRILRPGIDRRSSGAGSERAGAKADAKAGAASRERSRG